jgi:hypothetical protein
MPSVVRCDDSSGSETSTSGILPLLTVLIPEAETALSRGDLTRFPSLVHAISFTATDRRCPHLPPFFLVRRPWPPSDRYHCNSHATLLCSLPQSLSQIRCSPSGCTDAPRSLRLGSPFTLVTPPSPIAFLTASRRSSRLLPTRATSFSNSFALIWT